MNYVYILRCKDGSLYTGWTNHLEKRVAAHGEGKGAKYTKSRLPVCLVHSEAFDTKEEAMRREYAIKQLSREEKLRMISQSGTCAGTEISAQTSDVCSSKGDKSLR